MSQAANTTKKRETADLVTFTEEILNGKLHSLCREKQSYEHADMWA